MPLKKYDKFASNIQILVNIRAIISSLKQVKGSTASVYEYDDKVNISDFLL